LVASRKQPDFCGVGCRCAYADRLRDADVGEAILMSISTVAVTLNAQLRRRLDLRPDTRARAIL
jgi:hypothetical protein